MTYPCWSILHVVWLILYCVENSRIWVGSHLKTFGSRWMDNLRCWLPSPPKSLGWRHHGYSKSYRGCFWNVKLRWAGCDPFYITIDSICVSSIWGHLFGSEPFLQPSGPSKASLSVWIDLSKFLSHHGTYYGEAEAAENTSWAMDFPLFLQQASQSHT